VLKSRGTKYRDLARALGLSEPSIKRLFSQRTFTLQRLEQVCAALEIDFYELAKLARGAAESVDEMSLAQEQALASDSKLLGVFYLVFNQWQPDDNSSSAMCSRAPRRCATCCGSRSSGS